MSFIDKMKEAGDKASKAVAKSHQEHQAKVADIKEARGEKLGGMLLVYMGGYNDKKKAQGTVVFYDKQVEFSSPLSTKFTIPSSHIKKAVIEGKNEANRRVTVTRLLALGIFAFALKKKNQDKESYLTLELTDGQEVIFFVDKISPMELKLRFVKVLSKFKQVDAAEEAKRSQPISHGGVADELLKLAELKEKGILTQVEFDKKKSDLLK